MFTNRYKFNLLLLLFTFAVSQEEAKEIAIVNVNLIHMESDEVLKGQTVLIKNNKIESISKYSNKKFGSNTIVINGSDKFLIPGLADMHVHIRNKDELLNYVNYGVTTIMHMGGRSSQGKKNLDYKEQINAGTLIGPQIITTKRIFDGDPRSAGSAYSIASEELAIELVQESAKQGYDFIKVYNNISEDVFKAIVTEAKLHSLPVMGHLPRNYEAKTALENGLDMVVHSEEFYFAYFKGPRKTKNLDKTWRADYSRIPELVTILKTNNVVVTPNLSYAFSSALMWDDLDISLKDDEINYVEASVVRNEFILGNINRRKNIENFVFRDQMKYSLTQELTRDFQTAGILQVLGTDASQAGLFPGKSAHRELTELVKAGLSNYEALAIATRNAGTFAKNRIPKLMAFGQVKVGYKADLLLLEENPLEDIRHTKGILAVIANGKWLPIEKLSAEREILKTKYTNLKLLDKKIESAAKSENAQKHIHDLVEEYSGNVQYLSAIQAKLNSIAYQKLGKKNYHEAIKIFKLNTKNFKNSANAWDSLAEAYLIAGNKMKAIEFYKKALDQDPSFSSAKKQLAKLLK